MSPYITPPSRLRRPDAKILACHATNLPTPKPRIAARRCRSTIARSPEPSDYANAPRTGPVL